MLGPLLDKRHSAATTSEILVSKLYPAKFSYSTKTELLVVGLDYVTKVEKTAPNGQSFKGDFKPVDQEHRNRARQQELDKRMEKKKRSKADDYDDDFIDNANVPLRDENFWSSNAEPEPKLLPPRKRTKSMSC
jgi:hypothetical protein